jgi:rod shape-determining protein MreC
MFLLLGYIIGAARLGALKSITSDFVGFITAPIKYVSTKVSGAASDFLRKFTTADAIYTENLELKEKNRELEDRLAKLESYDLRIKELEAYLDLKEKNLDQKYVSGMVIGRDPDDKFHSFSVDVGKLDGIHENDPVITSSGLVGIVREVNLSDSKVSTILNSSISVGAFSQNTLDVGIVQGTLELAIDKLTRMRFIPNESAIKIGDIIITSGTGGTFPKGLTIGRVKEVNEETSGTSKYAIIEPVVDVSSIKEVVVITSFRGQTSVDGTGQSSEPDVSKPGTSSQESGSGGTQ